MSDPFLDYLGRRSRRPDAAGPAPVHYHLEPTGAGRGLPSRPHSERAHSKFSASGAERWFNCPGSVELSEGRKDRSSPWAVEGTEAHEVLESILRHTIDGGYGFFDDLRQKRAPQEMVDYGFAAAKFILRIADEAQADVTAEERVYLDFIHPEMFGTYDAAVVDYFGTLHVFDYKYGAGQFVSPVENLQMIFYGIGVAAKHSWNFKRVRLWIIQPRVRGYDGPLFWELPARNLRKDYVPRFAEAVERVEREPRTYVEGSWCHWCRARPVCPLKLDAKMQAAKNVFSVLKE